MARQDQDVTGDVGNRHCPGHCHLADFSADSVSSGGFSRRREARRSIFLCFEFCGWNGSKFLYSPVYWNQETQAWIKVDSSFRLPINASRRGIVCVVGSNVLQVLTQILVSDWTLSMMVATSNMTGAGWATIGSTGNGVGQFGIPLGIALRR